MSDALINCSNLAFSWPDDIPVFRDLSFTVGGGRTGLVAPNGAGKSTLLKLIAGEYRPSGGTVSVEGLLGYLPQSLPLVGDLTVAEVLGIAPVLRALDAIESGGGRARSTSPRSATTGTWRSAPVPSWTGSASGTSPSRGGCTPSAAARSSPSAWRHSC